LPMSGIGEKPDAEPRCDRVGKIKAEPGRGIMDPACAAGEALFENPWKVLRRDARTFVFDLHPDIPIGRTAGANGDHRAGRAVFHCIRQYLPDDESRPFYISPDGKIFPFQLDGDILFYAP